MCVVVGEKVVTPSSIVQLAFSCRYIHPSTPSSIKAVPPKPKLLPNGDSHDEKTEPLAGVEDETLAEKVNGITKEVVEKAVGRKGKVDEKKLWAANGYAHAPRWPQVRSSFMRWSSLMLCSLCFCCHCSPCALVLHMFSLSHTLLVLLVACV